MGILPSSGASGKPGRKAGKPARGCGESFGGTCIYCHESYPPPSQWAVTLPDIKLQNNGGGIDIHLPGGTYVTDTFSHISSWKTCLWSSVSNRVVFGACQAYGQPHMEPLFLFQEDATGNKRVNAAWGNYDIFSNVVWGWGANGIEQFFNPWPDNACQNPDPLLTTHNSSGPFTWGCGAGTVNGQLIITGTASVAPA